MELSFETRETAIYREFFRQSRRTQETAECVVPDTDADIEKIAAVQGTLCLKSKDLTGHGVLITGEASASVLYIREGQTGLSFVRMKKPFTLEYEVENLELDSLAQVTLFLQGTEVRAVNPRKLSVTFEVEGELCCYREESLCTDAALPESAALGLHARTEERSLVLPNAVCEKSLAIHEQFSLPAGKTAPSRLVSEKTALQVADCQLIGSRAILKGTAEITVCALSDGREEPERYVFSAPFSQIVEVDTEQMSACTVRPEVTGSYFELVDTISGERVVDMELHAVLQLVCFERQSVRFVTDVYSNLMPAEPLRELRSYELVSEAQRRRLSAEERVTLTESCGELLMTLASLARLSADADKLSAAVNLDFLYRNAAGQLSAGRRTLSLSQELGGKELQLLGARVASLRTQAEGEAVNCTLTLEIDCVERTREELSAVKAVSLDEEKAWPPESFPTLTLVRPEGESLWALAKSYHSSVEKIREYNADAENGAAILLIPRWI